MSSRGTLKTWLRNALGTSSDDPAFSDAILEPLLQQAYDAIVADLVQVNPHYLSSTVTLAADSSTSHNYTLTSQAATFAGWLEVRLEDSEGIELHEARAEELRRAGADHFCITGPDESAVLTTSPDTEAGIALWMRYRTWPALFIDDNSVPSGVPSRFHDVVYLECLFVFALGGEQRTPPELRERWQTRRSQLMAHVSRRGIQPGQTRIVEDYE